MAVEIAEDLDEHEARVLRVCAKHALYEDAKDDGPAGEAEALLFATLLEVSELRETIAALLQGLQDFTSSLPFGLGGG